MKNKLVSFFDLEKYNFKRLSVYSIAMIGVFVGLITATKILDIAMPKINDYAVWEIYWTFGALAMIALPFFPALLTLFIAPFVWMAIGQTDIVSPWSFVLDYLCPLMGLFVIKFCSNKWWSILGVFIAFAIKILCHTWSGVLFWDTPWWSSFVFNFPFVAITSAITLPIVFISYNQLKRLKEKVIMNEMNRY